MNRIRDKDDYILTPYGRVSSPLSDEEACKPLKWYHKMLVSTISWPLLALVKCLEWIKRRLKHE